jgi:hypothetical protein
LKFAREMLLDGFLVKERIVAQAPLESALSGTVTNGNEHSVHLLDYLCVELWIRCWRNTARSLVGAGRGIAV